MCKTGWSEITTLKRPSTACSSAATGNLHFAITSSQVCRPDGTSRPRAPWTWPSCGGFSLLSIKLDATQSLTARIERTGMPVTPARA